MVADVFLLFLYFVIVAGQELYPATSLIHPLGHALFNDVSIFYI
jgi:hypothetical protein